MLTVSTPAPSFTPSPVLPGDYTPRERFIRLPEVLYTTGLSRSTVYEMMSRCRSWRACSAAAKSPAIRWRTPKNCWRHKKAQLFHFPAV